MTKYTETRFSNAPPRITGHTPNVQPGRDSYRVIFKDQQRSELKENVLWDDDYQDVRIIHNILIAPIIQYAMKEESKWTVV